MKKEKMVVAIEYNPKAISSERIIKAINSIITCKAKINVIFHDSTDEKKELEKISDIAIKHRLGVPPFNKEAEVIEG